MDLDSMKYSDLQQLAKSIGLKANIKADKLLKALKGHFEQQESSDNGNTASSDDTQIQEEKEAAAEPKPKPVNDALVTTRRGKKQQAKRKYSGDGADPNPKPEQNPVQDDTKSSGEEAAEEEVVVASGDKRSSKRRKVSSAKDTETPAPEMKPESAGNNAIPEGTNQDVKKTAGKIPRHEGLMKKKAALKPTTPNFKKLHEAHFSKMESIDSYMQRKNKQMEVLRNSVKDLKAQSENGIKKSADTKAHAKPPVSRASLFSPGVPEKKVEKRRVTQASKPAIKNNAPFRPSILATNKVNVRFSQTTQDNEHKRSLVKTPARMSPMLPLTPTPGRKSEIHANKNAAPVNKTPGSTPFIFSAASGPPSTNKKNMFNLKASLSRPLTYKPHKGKLKPFGEMAANAALDKSQASPSRQKNYKQHQVQTRDKRRMKHNEDRKQKKEKIVSARRGLVMA
ncbi:nucleolar and spindle-associated protein 1 [Neoarius graeffei]|uniref:nucleolar and spindle-associated protein 1 n=1 Tax=Neoarius graeffei TaxID=443677 RepID=UPI00298D2DA4|nr:nucleolar and spindle-associated protein 1 [Neoarius graeffei]